MAQSTSVYLLTFARPSLYHAIILYGLIASIHWPVGLVQPVRGMGGCALIGVGAKKDAAASNDGI